jgi:hypothetical protein
MPVLAANLTQMLQDYHPTTCVERRQKLAENRNMLQTNGNIEHSIVQKLGQTILAPTDTICSFLMLVTT